MKTRHILYSLLFTFPSVVALWFLQAPVSSVESGFTRLKYQLRGSRSADSNIVLVYIDNDAVKSLGWPVRRNFYALMIKSLTDLKVKVIGIDIQFEVPSNEYPEYDDLLSLMLENSGRVVLPSYFKSVEIDGEGNYRGSDYHSPLRTFSDKAAAIGHENLAEGIAMPVVIHAGDSLVPSFGLQLLNQFAGGPHAYAELVTRKTVHLQHPGPITSFATFPFLEVLRSYDALRADLPTTIPVDSWKGKIVLVGVIGEGRSEFFETPLDARFPALALHATFVDNALQSSFIHVIPHALAMLFSMIVGVTSAASVLSLSPTKNRVVSLSILVGAILLSFLAFVSWNALVPTFPILLVGSVAIVASILYKHRLVQEQVHSLTAEKETVVRRLRDREAKVASLEKELLDLSVSRSEDRTNELLEEIRKNKAEIRALSLQADDMEEFGAPADAPVPATFENIVYSSTGRMKAVVEFIMKIAPSNAPVMILGESGTGKELVAQAIHGNSDRAGKPFVAVNCGALAETLLESELFGHEKGSFTGAVKDKMGRFELAHEGTIFLDEIGEVSEAFQLRLLRVLQEGQFERVGGTKTIDVNVRVLAATNKDLKELVRLRKFREDLYYRLNVLSVFLPPLRERQEDIPLLAAYFLRKEDDKMRVSRNVMDSFVSYRWPGNIRELESVIARAALLANSEKRLMIGMKDITEDIIHAAQRSVALEDQILESVREKGFSRSSVSETANELGGLNRGTVAEYLRGQCLQIFAEQGFDLEKAVQHVSLSSHPEVQLRARKKLLEYIHNISDAIDLSQPWDAARVALKPKAKNLPQRYHPYLEKTAEAFYRGVWKRNESNEADDNSDSA